MRLKLHWQILIAIALAIVAGALAGTDAAVFGVSFYSVFDFIGTLFLNALKMIIVPLIVASIITGIAGAGGASGLGRLGGKTVVYYLATSLLAILTGLMVVNAISPGIVGGQPVSEIFGFTQAEARATTENVTGHDIGSLAGVFLSMFPPNIVMAAAEGQMLGLIIFSILFGYFLTRITEVYAEAQYNFWQGLFEIMLGITELIIKFAPIGVFGLIAKVVADLDMQSDEWLKAVSALAKFSASVLLALALHLLVILPLILRFVAGVNPWRHYQAMAPALLTAFSTASSSATLPLTLECVEKNAGVSNRTSSFVLPLGATVNMDGTALYECVAVIFIAQAFNIDLSFAQQFLIVIVALLTSIGVAGIPAASLVAIVIIAKTVGIPEEGIALILAVDRILDMCRTAVNVFGDSCGAVTVARLEGEEGILEKKPA